MTANEKHQCGSKKKILVKISNAIITEGTGFLPIAVSRWAKRNSVSVSFVSLW
jgi:hypothetical protein